MTRELGVEKEWNSWSGGEVERLGAVKGFMSEVEPQSLNRMLRLLGPTREQEPRECRHTESRFWDFPDDVLIPTHTNQYCEASQPGFLTQNPFCML